MISFYAGVVSLLLCMAQQQRVLHDPGKLGRASTRRQRLRLLQLRPNKPHPSNRHADFKLIIAFILFAFFCSFSLSNTFF